jgi:hypothetical protein
LMAYEGRSSMHLSWLMACVASWHIATVRCETPIWSLMEA